MHPDNTSWLIITLIIAIIIVGISLLLIVSYSITLFNNKSRHEQEIVNIKMLNYNRELHSELAVQEQTFEQIAREVHDNWGQRLTLVKFQLQVMESQKIAGSLTLVNQLLDELRNFSRNLSSSRIRKIGLVMAIEEDIDFLKEVSGIHFSFDATLPSGPVDEFHSIILYRIFQEAESNILKHAKATKVNISLKEKEDELSFAISDDGVGFDPGKITSKGIGITNIQRRAKLVNGACHVFSAPGKGTLIELQIKRNTNDTSLPG